MSNRNRIMAEPPPGPTDLPITGSIEEDVRLAKLSAEAAEPEGASPVDMARDASQAGATLDVQVNLAPAGETINLGIRIGKLSGQERARLRLELAHLLWRHGITAGEIFLNGELQSAPEL